MDGAIEDGWSVNTNQCKKESGIWKIKECENKIQSHQSNHAYLKCGPEWEPFARNIIDQRDTMALVLCTYTKGIS